MTAATERGHEIAGHWIVAHWCATQAQYTTTHVRASVASGVQGYQYTYARSLGGIDEYAVHYASRAAALRAAGASADEVEIDAGGDPEARRAVVRAWLAERAPNESARAQLKAAAERSGQRGLFPALHPEAADQLQIGGPVLDVAVPRTGPEADWWRAQEERERGLALAWRLRDEQWAREAAEACRPVH